MNIDTLKFSCTCGAIRRGHMKEKIKRFCFHRDIEFNLDENKGALESTLYYEFKGSADRIEELKVFLNGI